MKCKKRLRGLRLDERGPRRYSDEFDYFYWVKAEKSVKRGKSIGFQGKFKKLNLYRKIEIFDLLNPEYRTKQSFFIPPQRSSKMVNPPAFSRISVIGLSSN